MFPDKINTFVDLFGGAFNVGINVKAEHIIYNDIINYLSELFEYWSDTDIEEILSVIIYFQMKYRIIQKGYLGFL